MDKSKSKAEDATALLMEDHKRVEKMFSSFKKLTDADLDEKAELVRRTCIELKIHAQIEEEIFYPAVREILEEDDIVDEAEVEHATAKQLIGELESMEPDEPLFDAKFTVLGEYVRHHVQEEEKEMFPEAKRAKIDMVTLGEELALRKRELQQQFGLEEAKL